jgi:hypothetical protein
MSSETIPIVTDEFDLLYIRGVFGWSDLHALTRHNRITARITHIFSDPIEDLSNLCCALLRGEPQSIARLCDEPGSTVLTASIYAEQRHLTRIQFWAGQGWDDVPPCGSPVLSVDVKLRQFVGLVYRQLEKVRWLYREPSFQKNRDRFPHRAFDALEQLWIGSEP